MSHVCCCRFFGTRQGAELPGQACGAMQRSAAARRARIMGGQSSVAAVWQTVGTLTAAEAATELRTVADTLSVLHARQALLSLLLHCQAEATAAAEAATDTDSSCISSGSKALSFCASASSTAANGGSAGATVTDSASTAAVAVVASGTVSVSSSSARMAQQVAALLRLLLFRGWSCEALPDATTALSDFSSSDDLRAVPALLSPVVCAMLQLQGEQSSALQVGFSDHRDVDCLLVTIYCNVIALVCAPASRSHCCKQLCSMLSACY